jgi:SAM-dependent methyltransferase
MSLNPAGGYTDDQKLAARQRLWAASRREPGFDLFSWVVETAGLGPGSTEDVLDVGCGNGTYERALGAQDHRGRLVAADLSGGMLQEVAAPQRVQADVQMLPLRQASVDVVLAPHMLYHVPDVALAAQEMRRVLRSGGRAVAVTNSTQNLIELNHLVETAVGGGWKMLRPHDVQFNLETGGEELAEAFATVERVDCPPSAVVVTDLDAVAAYVASVDDHYSEQVDLPWPVIVERVRELAQEAADEHGELRFTSAVGAFVCRDYASAAHSALVIQ